MNESAILTILVGIYILNFVFDQVLSYLNLKHHSRELPGELQGKYDAEKYARSYDYHRANYRFSLIRSIPSFLIVLGLLVWGGFGWLDTYLRQFTTHPIGLPLLYFGVLYLVSDLINTPFQWYHTFVIEERFGFNRTTAKTFWLDKLKGLLVSAVLGGIVLGALLWSVQFLGENFWIWFWVFISGFTLFMQTFYTSLILPLFNKLTPLEDGELRQAIEAYSRQVNFPLENIYVIDGSRRSEKANAFFTGLGKRKKIVLYDTLIQKHSPEELVAVLAHEVGHYKKKHILKGMALSVLQTGITLFILSLFVQSPELSYALGAETHGIHLNLIAFGLLYSPISMLIGLLMNVFSRKNEFEADHFAATTFKADPLKEALIRLHEHNLSNLTPHPLYVFFNYSHPPLLQRLAALGG